MAEPETKVTMGGFLRAIRKKRGLTMVQVATKLNICYQYVGRWELDQTRVHPNRREEIAAAYKMTEEEKEYFTRLFSNPFLAGTFPSPLTEEQIFYGWVRLEEKSRKRILKAMNAYENA